MSDEITIGDGIRLLVRRSARARRMTLRVPRDGGPVVLTMPARMAERHAHAFAQEKADWILRHCAARPVPRMAGHGAVVPVEGQGLTITPGAVRAVQVQGDQLLVPQSRAPGPAVQSYLRHLAHERLRIACDRFAGRLGRPFRAIALRDTRSRWGSCSADGRLMFSWRLSMAPPAVLDYVAAHEVAHLAHMDHSPRFWAAVEGLYPGHQPQRDWLRRHGGDLLIWKFRD